MKKHSRHKRSRSRARVRARVRSRVRARSRSRVRSRVRGRGKLSQKINLNLFSKTPEPEFRSFNPPLPSSLFSEIKVLDEQIDKIPNPCASEKGRKFCKDLGESFMKNIYSRFYGWARKTRLELQKQAMKHYNNDAKLEHIKKRYERIHLELFGVCGLFAQGIKNVYDDSISQLKLYYGSKAVDKALTDFHFQTQQTKLEKRNDNFQRIASEFSQLDPKNYTTVYANELIQHAQDYYDLFTKIHP
jgi:hypothetical protein